MEILQTSLKCFSTLGISPKQSKQEFYFNHKILLGFSLLGSSLVTHVLYLIYVAQSFDKYIESICATIAMVVVITCFVSVVFGMSILFESIDSIETLLATSEYKN